MVQDLKFLGGSFIHGRRWRSVRAWRRTRSLPS